MITNILPLSAGNAVRLFLELAPGALWQRVLAKAADTFSGPNDAGALTILSNSWGDNHVDARDSLVNGVPVFYRAYDWNGTAFVDQGSSFTATPNTTYIGEDGIFIVQELVRDRVQLGINAAIVNGWLTPPTGTIAVNTAPFSIAEGTTFPTVSVHMDSSQPEVRGIGDDGMPDFWDIQSEGWEDTQGWLARESLGIVGVSQNPDERIQLRTVLRHIVQANLEVFAGAGLRLIEFSQNDTEQFSENNVPLYMSNGNFSCLAPAWVRYAIGPITGMTLTTSALTTTDHQPDPYPTQVIF